MRKNLLFAGLALALASLAASSCAKIIEKETNPGESAGKKVTLYVQDNEWLPEDGVRSSYDPSLGVKLSGTEDISLYYYESSQFNGESGVHGIKGSPTGAGVYTFTDPGADPSSWWYSLVPYSYIMQRVAPTSDPKYQYGQTFVGPVQYPGADTFDPQADILVGKPFQVVAGTGTITAFKRMVAPWRILVTGLESTDKIYSATVTLSGDPTSISNCLAGSFSITLADTFDGTVIRGIGSSTRSRCITAYYGEGLSKGASGWPVWLMVNPIDIPADTQMTLTVATKDKIYTRTAEFTAARTLASDKINKLEFNIKGSGVTSKDIEIQDFTEETLNAGSNYLTTANGTTLNWVLPYEPKWTASAKDNGSQTADGMTSSTAGTVFIIPDIPSKSLKKLRLLLHPCSALSSSGITIDLMNGTNILATYNASTVNSALGNGGYYNGGILDITTPDGYESLSGLTLKFAKDIVLSGAILFSETPTDYGGDYYTAFAAGKSIRIGGTVYNKDNNTYTSIAVTTQDALNTAASSYDVIFLDGDSDDELTLSANMTLGGKAIIGRYPDKQPVINAASYQIKPTGDMAFKNVTIKHSSHLIYLDNASFSLGVEDCTVICTGTSKSFIYDSHATNCIKNLYINNSVFVQNASTGFGVYYTSGKKKTSTEQANFKSYVITNNVFCNKGTITDDKQASARLILLNATSAEDGKTAITMPNIDIQFTGNTVYGWSARIVGVSQPGRITVNNNVFEAPLLAATVGLFINSNGTQKNYNSFCVNNWARSTADSYAWTVTTNSYLTLDNNVTGNSSSLGDPFLGTKVINDGYLPINTSVVTNGAGATYDTKLWRSWP